MKQKLIILSVPILVFWLFGVQNAFLFGLPFVHAGSINSDVSEYMGEAEYSGDISTGSNVIYIVRFYPLILATLNVNENVEGTFAGDNRGTSVELHNVNWIKWTWVPCFEREYVVKQSLSRPDGEPYWHPTKPLLSLLIAFVPAMLFLFFLSQKFRKFGNSVNSV